jgi:antitoxin (DNA-binding transcriptional repressor) of toxin-antitoxin stability system
MIMLAVGLRDLKAKLSKYVGHVRNGEIVLVDERSAGVAAGRARGRSGSRDLARGKPYG